MLIRYSFLVLVVIAAMHIMLECMLADQQGKNTALQIQIARKQAELILLENKKQEIAMITAQLQFINELRRLNYHSARVLSGLFHAASGDVLLKSIHRQDRAVLIEGDAVSDEGIVLFMENITKTAGFFQPEVISMSARDDKVRQFRLRVTG